MTGPPKWRADLLLALVCFIWGASFIIVKTAISTFPVLLFLALRFSIATLLLAIPVMMRPRRATVAHNLRGGVLAGVCLFTGYFLQTFGLRYTTAAKAGFITGFYIPLVPVLGALVYRKRPEATEVLGVLLAFAGSALMTIQNAAVNIGHGDVLVAVSTIAYAFHILVLAKYTKTADVSWLAMVQIAVAAMLGWLTFWMEPSGQLHWSGAVWLALAVSSVLSTAFAFSALTWAQKHTSATHTALILSLEPVFAWFAAWFAAGESLTGRGLAGAALILTGILLAELKPFRSDKHQPLSPEIV